MKTWVCFYECWGSVFTESGSTLIRAKTENGAQQKAHLRLKADHGIGNYCITGVVEYERGPREGEETI